MVWSEIIIGGLVLALGRKLFWLFVAAGGFAFGLSVATQRLSAEPEWLIVVIPVVCGLVGALLAVFFQQLAVIVAGFAAGAFVAVSMVKGIGLAEATWYWAGLVGGGLLGVVVIAIAFDWALIVLSSLAGAALLVEGLGLPPAERLGVGIGLFILGIILQTLLNARAMPAA